MYGIYVVAFVVCLAGNLAVRLAERGGWLPPWARVILAALTVFPLVAAAVLFWRMLRRDLDEMLQRIVLEGLAFALTVYVPLAALYVNLRTAGALTFRLDPPELLLTPALLVAVGIAVAWRRYR
jgi:hypothetical protein